MHFFFDQQVESENRLLSQVVYLLSDNKQNMDEEIQDIACTNNHNKYKNNRSPLLHVAINK